MLLPQLHAASKGTSANWCRLRKMAHACNPNTWESHNFEALLSYTTISPRLPYHTHTQSKRKGKDKGISKKQSCPFGVPSGRRGMALSVEGNRLPCSLVAPYSTGTMRKRLTGTGVQMLPWESWAEVGCSGPDGGISHPFHFPPHHC